MDSGIDFVITYLDGNDINWQTERNKYIPGEKSDVNPNRYRNWDNLQYLFRGIEKYAPWVRYVYFVTVGHTPAWLNTNNPKLKIIRHEDYIPKEWLPTFSSRCIDMNLHRIPSLSDSFVYFNDDMFLVSDTSPDVFFKDGKPCDTAVNTASVYKMKAGVGLHLAAVVNTAIINRHFCSKQSIRQHPGNWYNTKYGKFSFITLLMSIYNNFVGFWNFHTPYSYRKETYKEVWEVEKEVLEATSSHKFRESTDPNHWIFTYWQYASGNFYPRNPKYGRCFQLSSMDDAKSAYTAIVNGKYKFVCLNDSIQRDEEFKDIADTVNSALAKIFPEKSTFEL